MTIQIERPDVNQSFEYALRADEGTLLLMMEAMDDLYRKYDHRVSLHVECDRLSPGGCKVVYREAGLTGSCQTELSVALSHMQQAVAFIEGARFVREHREVKSEASFRALQAEAQRVVETAKRTLEPTSAWPTIEQRRSAGLDPEAAVTTPVSEEFTGKYEVDTEIVERVHAGLKENGVIGATQDNS